MNLDGYLATVGQAALCNPPTLRNTYDMARDVIRRNVVGDFVECGVFAGAQVAAMARAAIDSGDKSRLIHLFDSFVGIPEAGPNDADGQPGLGERPSQEMLGRLVSSGISVCSAEQVRKNLLGWGIPREMLVFHQGWFQHTVQDWDRRRISLLRLDGDLYESTSVCINGLYPFLSSGGVCIVDDYALVGCRKAVQEYFGGDAIEVNEVEGGGGPVWWIK
jgi:O-methyltransferase